MIQYFQDYFGISEEEAKQSIECYSMLGEYSKSKNTYEFEQFQKDTSDSPNKIKFMFVMNPYVKKTIYHQKSYGENY